PAEPARTAVRAALLRQAHRQVELRARPSHRLNAHAQPFKLKLRRRVVLQRQHHLEQRMVRQRARGVERLNQPLKRKLLVAIRRKIARTHPPNQITEARMARRVRAQHQRVDEKPDQILQRTVRAPRYRAADRDVIARPKPAQQRRQPTRAPPHPRPEPPERASPPPPAPPPEGPNPPPPTPKPHPPPRNSSLPRAPPARSAARSPRKAQKPDPASTKAAAPERSRHR